MRKILMVYPSTPSTYWSFDHALPFVGKRSSFPPLGLLTVAALLPPRYQVRLIDMNVDPLTEEDIEWSDLVFVSAMIVQRATFAEVVRRCNLAGRPVVAGGPYPISSHEEISGVDHFVLDEAELTLPRFLADLESGSPRRIYRDPEKADLTQTPPPRFDLIDVSVYDSMVLQFSRGCPYSCEFCDIIEMFGRTQRTKRPEQFIAEMEAVYATGFRGPLFIVDDNFVGNRRVARDVLGHIAAWQREHGYPFSLTTEASVDVAADEALLEAMVQAGMQMIFVGIESPDAATLTAVGKRQNARADLMASVRAIQRRGIEVAGGFILGFDTDDEGIFDRQIAFVQEAGIPLAMVGLLTALPNTELYRRLDREGRLLHRSSGNNTHGLSLNFVPRLPAEVLAKGYQRVLTELYSPRRYFERCEALIAQMPSAARRSRSVGPRELRALGMSLVKQGFSHYGPRYLLFLIRTILRKPRLFPTAVGLAVRGYHFITITGEIPRAEAFAHELQRVERSLWVRVRLAARRGNGSRAVATAARIDRLLADLRRRYDSFGEGMQRYVDSAFGHAVKRFELWRGMLLRF